MPEWYKNSYIGEGLPHERTEPLGNFDTHRFTHLDEEAGEAVVSIWAATDDYIWNTQERSSPEESLSTD